MEKNSLIIDLDGTTNFDWMEQAACKGQWEKMHPSDGEGVKEAQAICANCEVKEECLEFALTKPPEEHGVWGGESERERRRMYRKRQRLQQRLGETSFSNDF